MTHVSSAKLLQDANSFFYQKKGPPEETRFFYQKKESLEKSLEDRLDQLFNGDVSKHNLFPYVSYEIKKIMESEWGKKELELALSRLSAYDDYILQASKESDLNVDFIKAYLAQESLGDPQAVSPKGATGLGGLMKPAASEVEVRVDQHIDERVDPKSIIGSSKYMRKCVDLFNDYVLAMLAYNAGPTWTTENLSDILKSKDIMKNRKIYSESQFYVLRVIAKTHIISNPELYNLEIKKRPLVSDMIFTEHITKKNTSLKELAKFYRVKLNDLKTVNPAIKSNSVPKGVTVKIPKV